MDPISTPYPSDHFEPAGAVNWTVASALGVYLLSQAFSASANEAFASRRLAPNQGVIRVWLVLGIVLHAFEARYTHRLANRLGLHDSARRWATTNFFVGVPVLMKLKKLAAAQPAV